jgi:D-alanine-D-alanine ligase
MPKKLNIATIFGGRSGEHEVSLASATSIIKNLDRQKYNIIPIGISKIGEWFTGPDVLEKFKNGLKNKNNLREVSLKFNKKSVLSAGNKSVGIDVFFPILHGTFGEDGTIQGLFEMINAPYVGAGVLGSAVGMDKIIQKQILENAGLPIVKYTWLNAKAILKRSPIHIVRRIGFPCFIKPANGGSSVGMTKAHNLKELRFGLNLAKKYDSKIIIEKAVPNLREFECSVLGNENPKASAIGEIIASNEYYDYDAKYVDGKSKAVIPAKIPENLSQKIRFLATQAFKATACEGMARVDFLYDAKKGKIYINELNTIPGFTQISMYPKLWIQSGLKYGKLLDKLINLAVQKFNQRKKLFTAYKPSKKWYK